LEAGASRRDVLVLERIVDPGTKADWLLGLRPETMSVLRMSLRHFADVDSLGCDHD